MKTQGNEHIYADVRKNMNSEEFEKSIESVLNDYNVSKEEKVVKLFKLGLYPVDIIEHIRVGLAEVYYILDLAKKEGKFNDKLKEKNGGIMKTQELNTEKVRISLPSSKDKRFKSWRKILTGIDKTKDNGYAFLGDFISTYKNKDIELPVGTYILVYDEVGSVKYHQPEVYVYRVDGDFKLTELFCSYSWNWSLDLRDEVAKLFEDNEAKKEKLTIEKEALLKRLDEINALLEAIENEKQ